MVFNDAMKEMASNEAEISIDGCQSPLDKRPAVGSKMGNIHVRVMQICYGDLSLVSISCPSEMGAARPRTYSTNDGPKDMADHTVTSE